MKGHPVHDALRFSSTLLAGSLAGMELASWAVVHPAVARLSHIEQVHAEKALYRRFAQIQAPQMAFTITLAGVTAAASEGSARTFAAVATGCFAGMLVLTFAGNMPINVAILRWEEPGDPARWQQLRRRWDRIHTLRILLDTGGFALLLAACLEP
ncbi:MAG: DUF1772 domain-containing protein [Nocardioidaceae bacterium]|nr:DUF1772 domain-containing protein [Nocardioidaceae bacterium]